MHKPALIFLYWDRSVPCRAMLSKSAISNISLEEPPSLYCFAISGSMLYRPEGFFSQRRRALIRKASAVMFT